MLALTGSIRNRQILGSIDGRVTERMSMPRRESRSGAERRREFLKTTFGSSLAACASSSKLFAQLPDAQPPAAKAPIPEDPEVQRVFDRFAGVGLPEPGVTRQGNFLAVGTSRPDFSKRILRIAEDTAAGYVRFFSGLRLPATNGKQRLVVVVLANAGQYSRFNGQNKARNEGGHYDIDENWTVTFDHRGRSKSVRADLERANVVTMIHEIAHQLSFNTGLLSRDADIPMMISEGLATMAEPSSTSVLPGFSEVNRPRIAVLEQLLRAKRARWIPLEKLIENDDAFDAPDDGTVQVAYAQSWLFWDSVIRQSRFREKLGPYLDRVNAQRNPAERLDDFVASFGSVRAVEAEMSANLQSLASK